MIEHVWTVLCSRAVTDVRTNNVSLQNVIERFTLGEVLPLRFVTELELASLWTRADMDEPAVGEGRVSFMRPSGETSEIFTRELDLMNHFSLRSLVHIDGMTIPEEGRYYFLVDYRDDSDSEWQQVARIPLQIVYDPEMAQSGRRVPVFGPERDPDPIEEETEE